MRLVFPGGEHAPVELRDGTTSIGSDAGCAIVLGAGGGVAAQHCEIIVAGGQARVRPLDATAPTVLNGRQVDGEAVIGPGDLLLFGRTGCAVGASEPKPAAVAPKAPVGDDGRTRVRAALPRFLLRGVSGATLGKTFAVTDNAVIGRQPDCDIPIAAEEISRHHARLKVTPDGIQVEDLGSANGTFVNGKRVQSALLKPGEELRLDTVRFLLVTPGMDARQQSAGARIEPAPPAAASGGASKLWIVVGVVVLAAIAFAVLTYTGKA